MIVVPSKIAHATRTIAVHSLNTPGLMHKATQLLGINSTYCYAALWRQIVENYVCCQVLSFVLVEFNDK